MGFGTPLAAACRYESLGIGTGVGTTVTASATTTLKGSYTTLGTSAFPYDGFLLSWTAITGQTARRYRLDIAINTGGADTIIVQDLFVEMPSTSALNVYQPVVYIPVAIPSGAAVKARLQCSTASGTLSVSLAGYEGNAHAIKGFPRLISCTDWTNNDPTNSTITLNGTTATAYSEVMASTPSAIAALYFEIDSKGVSATAGLVAWTIGFGGAGSEKTLLTFATALAPLTTPCISGPLVGPIPCKLPAGTRLAIKAQASAANTSVIAPVLTGLAP